MHTHLYEHTYANSTPMSISEGLAGMFRDSRSHHGHIAVDGDIAYHKA